MLSASVFLRFLKTEPKCLRFKYQLELSKITTDVGKIIFHVTESNSCLLLGFGHKTGWQLMLQLYENITVKCTDNSNYYICGKKDFLKAHSWKKIAHTWEKKWFKIIPFAKYQVKALETDTALFHEVRKR